MYMYIYIYVYITVFRLICRQMEIRLVHKSVIEKCKLQSKSSLVQQDAENICVCVCVMQWSP